MTGWRATRPGPGWIVDELAENGIDRTAGLRYLHGWLSEIFGPGLRRFYPEAEELVDEAHTFYVQGRATDDEIDALLGGIFEFADRRRILLRPDWLPGPTRPEATR